MSFQHSNSQPSDEQLALQAQNGDRLSLKELVERHHALLLGFLYRLTSGDHFLADDLVQEAFFHMIRALPSYQYPRRFKTWLYAIGVNCARDYYKQAYVNRTLPINQTESEEAFDYGDGHSPDDNMVEQDELKKVLEALQQISLHQREVLILRYSQDLSLAEIAETLGIPTGTVKSRISLGLQRLRELNKVNEVV